MLGRLNIYDLVAAALAAIAGGLMASRRGYTFNYWVSCLSVSITFFIALSLKDPQTKTSSREEHYWAHIKQAWLFLKRSPTLLFVMVSPTQ